MFHSSKKMILLITFKIHLKMYADARNIIFSQLGVRVDSTGNEVNSFTQETKYLLLM